MIKGGKMKIKIWITKGCQSCKLMKIYLDEKEIPYNVTDIDSPEELKGNVDAMVQLCKQNMEMPLIQCDGKFIKPNEFISFVKERREKSK